MAARQTYGSSPLARGTRRGRAVAPLRQRFIPARAGNTSARRSTPPRRSVHPRSRGEHIRRYAPDDATFGSSPLARGTPRYLARRQAHHRFIPARAGNTGRRPRSGPARPVHPRSRGEHIHTQMIARHSVGSSPLARGTRAGGEIHHPAGRFIPARAGNTMRSTWSAPRATVHPRSRGEHSPPRSPRGPVHGSSPLARGTLAGIRRGLRSIRFIPARAGNTLRGAHRHHPRPVHPRSRGEHLYQTVVDWIATGSSPLARGTPEDGSVVARYDRFIPARAGNTRPKSARTTRVPVHPRSRGEHAGAECLALVCGGSSPLARGTLRLHLCDSIRVRFIPARAGNTRGHPPRPALHPVHPRSRGEHASWRSPASPSTGSSPLARGTRTLPRKPLVPCPVHPRSRGEHRLLSPRATPPTGSSPLARGTPEDGSVVARYDRFIPARAGNTRPKSARTTRVPVHPRSRGEHAAATPGAAMSPGSSPLARGTHHQELPVLGVRRFIPARAGNTRDRHVPATSMPVHPRSRGEHLIISPILYWNDGSSPLARGTRTGAARRWTPIRFIPARAGNTSAARRRRGSLPVHPRSRGEHVREPRDAGRRFGSSPLARGTPRRLVGVEALFRFIPARAGNTLRRLRASAPRPVHPRSRGEHLQRVPASAK